MADQSITQMVEGFDNLGQFVYGVVRNEYAMYFISLVVFCLMLTALIKSALCKIPMFETVNSSGNVVAWCISILGTLSIGWRMKDQGPGYLVSALGGPFGTFLICILGIFVGYWVFKSMENANPRGRWYWTLQVPILLCDWLFGYSLGADASVFLVFFGLFIGGWAIVLIMNVIRGRING